MSNVKPIRRRGGDSEPGGNENRANDAQTQSQYQPYKDAAWGFINTWYPALFSEELAEGEVEGIQICGIPIVLRRIKGKVYALKDQCVHRGVRMSAKPMCLTDSTISCWYHGFTYDLESGELTTIVGNPEDKLIGTTGVTTYPVEEVSGLIFVFVRDDEFPDEDVPALAEDLPIRFPENSKKYPYPLWEIPTPSLLDDDVVALGIHRMGETNWRVAVENGFDNAHILIHQDNAVVQSNKWVLPLGIRPVSDEAITLIEDENGPKGLMQWLFTDRWEPVLENEALGMQIKGVNGRAYRTSVVMPGVLMVENWPEEGVVQYEWCVPVTDDTYVYWEVLARKCPTEEERKDFEYRYRTVYEPICLRGFNDCDIYARQAMQDFYGDGSGWDDEQLVETDVSAITWRKVASRHNRGIAKPGRGVDGSVKASSIRIRRAAEGKGLSYTVEKIED